MQNSAVAEFKQPLYLRIARKIESQIRIGALRAGDRIPSIRTLRRQERVSTSTVLQAYFLLENEGWIEPRPQSGFYVKIPNSERLPEPKFRRSSSSPSEVGVSELVMELIESIGNPKNVPLSAACASADLFPVWRLNRAVQKVLARYPSHSATYNLPPGSEALRRQIARRAPQSGCLFSPDEILITSGALEALNLALRATVKPGEVVAVESPTYFGVLQCIESLGMKAIEIPTHPQHGMELDLLERAICRHHVRACVSMPIGHNPLGFILSDDRKKALVDLTSRHEVALIEDDVYGELAYDQTRPHAAKSFDRKGLVLLCSSFSKTVAPGFRVGWIQAGRFQREVERLKFITSIATPTLTQLAIAEFLESGGYDRFLRKLRRAFANQVQQVSQAIADYFPDGTRVSRPTAGYVLWVELPPGVRAMDLYRRALEKNISILPGTIFSASGRYVRHIRISCGMRWSASVDRAIATLGKLCSETPHII